MKDALDLVHLWVLIEKVDEQEEYLGYIVRVFGGVHLLKLLDMAVHGVVCLHILCLPLRHAF